MNVVDMEVLRAFAFDDGRQDVTPVFSVTLEGGDHVSPAGWVRVSHIVVHDHIGALAIEIVEGETLVGDSFIIEAEGIDRPPAGEERDPSSFAGDDGIALVCIRLQGCADGLAVIELGGIKAPCQAVTLLDAESGENSEQEQAYALKRCGVDSLWSPAFNHFQEDNRQHDQFEIEDFLDGDEECKQGQQNAGDYSEVVPNCPE